MIALSTLRGFPSLREFTDAELEILVSATQTRSVPRGAVLCSEGSPGASCYLVVKGALEIRKHTSAGERVLATVTPGTWVGQIALVDRGPRTASVAAKDDAEILELSRDMFEQLLRAKSSLGLRFQEQIALAGIRQLRQAIARLATLLASTPSKATAAPAAGTNEHGDVLRYIQSATTEWSMSLDELDAMETVQADGVIGTAELRARRGY